MPWYQAPRCGRLVPLRRWQRPRPEQSVPRFGNIRASGSWCSPPPPPLPAPSPPPLRRRCRLAARLAVLSRVTASWLMRLSANAALQVYGPRSRKCSISAAALSTNVLYVAALPPAQHARCVAALTALCRRLGWAARVNAGCIVMEFSDSEGRSPEKIAAELRNAMADAHQSATLTYSDKQGARTILQWDASELRIHLVPEAAHSNDCLLAPNGIAWHRSCSLPWHEFAAFGTRLQCGLNCG